MLNFSGDISMLLSSPHFYFNFSSFLMACEVHLNFLYFLPHFRHELVRLFVALNPGSHVIAVVGKPDFPELFDRRHDLDNWIHLHSLITFL